MSKKLDEEARAGAAFAVGAVGIATGVAVLSGAPISSLAASTIMTAANVVGPAATNYTLKLRAPAWRG